MRVVLNTTHLGVIGGGENYLMRLSMALDEMTEFYVTANWPDKFEKFNGFGKQFKVYNGRFEPDVFLHSSYFTKHPPIGNINYLVCFFPKETLKPGPGYHGVLAICNYSLTWAGNYYGMGGTVVEPCIDPSMYSVGKKEKKIISIGHFFRERDGHSKNQHVLVEAFEDLPEYELVLVGNVNSQEDQTYVNDIRSLARGKNVRIEINKDNQQLKAELSTASHLWHGNGYGRTSPSQTEHFGIVVLEAIASGCIPIVHDSGGAREIAGLVWREPKDLPRLTLGKLEVPQLARRHTVEGFREEVAKWVKQQELKLAEKA